MCSYNKINGVHGCENPTLLTQILREEWGFKGLVLADYGASKHIDTGLRAGLDYEPFPFVDFDGGENLTPAQVTAALQAGRINQGDIDTAVRHQLETLFRFGFFDRTPFVDDPSRINNGAHQKRARRAAEQGTVLLQNDGVLPLNSKRLGSLAVIGADATRYVNGGGSSDIDPLEFTSVLGGIQARAGKGVDVSFDPGNDLEQAAQAARGADAAVVVIADASSEGSDKPCLGIDCGAEPIDGMTIQRDALVEQIAAANPNTIVLLETAGPVLAPWRDQVAAVVEGWYPGGAAGSALAGCSSVTSIPAARLGDVPRHRGAAADLRESVLLPRRGQRRGLQRGSARRLPVVRQKGLKPAYPFGHGLSYSRFAFRGLKVSTGPARCGCPGLAQGRQRGRPQGHRGTAALREDAWNREAGSAASAAEGVQEREAEARRKPARPLPPWEPRFLLLERSPQRLGRREGLLPDRGGQVVPQPRPGREAGLVFSVG